MQTQITTYTNRHGVVFFNVWGRKAAWARFNLLHTTTSSEAAEAWATEQGHTVIARCYR